ncbi:hypothetical protein U728_723 [Clostridium botulinum 202F]|nr:hypothetical protein U728_723 [Clostridium botulinum 202F]KON14745.1 hypothetical protein ACP50_00920 [Clostridium botulinum]MBY6987071.1 DUF4355 domain-containing protein [Clostridium botulinum]NFH01719.1 DUF4355 domain-containing protein [Clostridium botulinum]NFP41003.1 DUF4355 domain-containing protein [Clostridium botulinum]
MKKTEITELLKDIADDAEIDETIKGSTLADLFKKDLTLDEVKNFVESSDDGKKYLQTYGDKRVTDGIKTWKDKNLQTLINDEVLKATGKKKTPEQIEIEQIKAQLKEQTDKAERAESIAKYKDVLAEKKIPMEMIDYFLTDNEETTNTRIDNFSTYVNDMVNNGVKDKMADGSYTPPGENGAGDLTADDVAKMMM